MRPLVTCAGLVAAWWLVQAGLGLPDYMLPSPPAVARALWTQRGMLLSSAWTTAAETLLGLALGSAMGIGSALLITLSAGLRRWLLPVLLLSQAVPVFALAPLLVLWLGFGIASKVVVAALVIFFPVMSAFHDGLARVPQGWLDLAYSMGARTTGTAGWRVLLMVRVPAALPALGSGLRVAACWAPVGAVIGEWVGASAGLGTVMLNANARVRTDLMFGSAGRAVGDDGGAVVGDGPGIAAAADLGGSVSSWAHGTGQALVAPDWPPLTAEALAPVLAAYPEAGAVGAVDWHSPRPFAASAVVRCTHATVFVKRHDTRVRSVADLMEEHAFIRHLRQHGAAVPRVLRTSDGRSAVAGTDGTYEVHALGEGIDLYRDAQSWTPVRSLADAYAAGEALARLHGAAAGFAAPPRGTRLLVAGDAVLCAPDPLGALERRVADDRLLRAALRGRDWRDDFHRVLLPWFDALRPFLESATPLWVHGDFHASNLLWHDGAVSAVLDFGLCNRASAMFDLATAIERNAIAWLDLTPQNTAIGHADLACALVQGYTGVLPLPDAQFCALRRVLPLVHVDFALSELAYFHGITGSACDAEAAYTDFLLGHAAWFGTASGQDFLDRVANRG